MRVPDRAGHVGDIVLGLNDLPAYSDNKAYLGAIIGRYGNRIASGSRDKTVRVWDAATGLEALSLKGHTSSVSSVAFSPDGKRIVSGS